MEREKKIEIRAIIGLGNPENQHYYDRHSIGFRIADLLVQQERGSWQRKKQGECATIEIKGHNIIVIKPMTYMNSSGDVIPALIAKGIKTENILVIHDELEKPFGNLSIKVGGSARGHNGLRSIISKCGSDFVRLRFGVGRPIHKEEVSTYVLESFSEPTEIVNKLIEKAVDLIKDLC